MSSRRIDASNLTCSTRGSPNLSSGRRPQHVSRSGQPQLRVCRGWQSPCEQVDLTTRQRVRAAEQGGSRLASASNRFLAHVGRDFLPRDRLRPDRPCNSARASRYRLLDRRVTDACSRLCVQLPSPIALSQLGRREPGSEKKLASPPGLGQNQKRLDDPRHEIVIPAIRQVNRVASPPRSEPTNHQAAATRLRPPDKRRPARSRRVGTSRSCSLHPAC